MKSISQLARYIADLGQNIQFVAFLAHFSVSEFAVEHLFFGHRIFGAALITVYAAVKEFWFDARYENNPPQTFMDNLQDFAGYFIGAWLGVVLR